MAKSNASQMLARAINTSYAEGIRPWLLEMFRTRSAEPKISSHCDKIKRANRGWDGQFGQYDQKENDDDKKPRYSMNGPTTYKPTRPTKPTPQPSVRGIMGCSHTRDRDRRNWRPGSREESIRRIPCVR